MSKLPVQFPWGIERENITKPNFALFKKRMQAMSLKLEEEPISKQIPANPPYPGAIWNPQTHRWRRAKPEEGRRRSGASLLDPMGRSKLAVHNKEVQEPFAVATAAAKKMGHKDFSEGSPGREKRDEIAEELKSDQPSNIERLNDLINSEGDFEKFADYLRKEYDITPYKRGGTERINRELKRNLGVQKHDVRDPALESEAHEELKEKYKEKWLDNFVIGTAASAISRKRKQAKGKKK